MTTATPRSYADHRQIEFTLVADLERLRSLARRLGLSALEEEVGEALGRIQDHAFSIAVVGEFKRGKSTFINALLGKEILPADVVPTSATVNRITFGLEPDVRIRYRDGGEERIGVDRLPEFVTKLTAEAEATAATVEEAVVSFPTPFCKNNVDILDTPGLSDEAAMTEITRAVLPRVDAALFMVLATAPFSQSESELLEELLVEHGLGRVVFVVTAMDRLHREEDRERVLDGIRERIQGRIREHAAARFGEGTPACRDHLRRVGPPRVLGVSGYDALVAKTEHDEELLAASGFPELESFLERFLTEESGLVALQTHAERVAGFCRTLDDELRSRLDSPALLASPDGVPGKGDPDPLRALLESLEWMVEATRRELAALEQRTREGLEERLSSLGPALARATGDRLDGMEIAAADLVPERLPRFVGEFRSRQAGAAREAADALAGGLLEPLRGAVEGGLRRVLALTVPAERIALHLRDAGVDGGEGEGEGDDGGGGVPFADLPFDGRERLAGLRSALRLPEGWEDRVEIQPMAARGPRFAQKAVDFVRLETLKADLHKQLAQRVRERLEASDRERRAALGRQVAAAFAPLREAVGEVERRVRHQLSALQVDGLRRAARAEQERERLGQLRDEVATLHGRARDLSRRLSGPAGPEG